MAKLLTAKKTAMDSPTAASDWVPARLTTAVSTKLMSDWPAWAMAMGRASFQSALSSSRRLGSGADMGGRAYSGFPRRTRGVLTRTPRATLA
jgi:hypothetical protein